MDGSLGKIKLLAPVTTCTFVPNEPLTACETVIPGETFAPSETLAPSATFKPSVGWEPTDRGERLACRAIAAAASALTLISALALMVS